MKLDRVTQPMLRVLTLGLAGVCFVDTADAADESDKRPNVILVMADDQGWGETGYAGHPRLKTPALDAMAANGLRFNRFYAGSAVCSPTRAAVLTGRSPVRTGVPSHGFALRHQEITLSQLLSDAGYQTAHFGKWHLNGLRGPGVPIFLEDRFHPGRFGFQLWLSVTNYFDRDPLLGRMGVVEDYEGDSSEVVVDEALKFLGSRVNKGRPFFTVIWYGTPHSPFKASSADVAAFEDLDQTSKHHYGELVALDRSMASLRDGLRDLKIERETLLWYCSDNGGLPRIHPPTVGGLRGNKGTLYEGGLRVPGLMEWPGKIVPGQTDYPACVMDILPTVLELAGIQYSGTRILDGVSLTGLFEGARSGQRQKAIGFRYKEGAAIVDNRWKILATKLRDKKSIALFDLESDPKESTNVAKKYPEQFSVLKQSLDEFVRSTDRSIAGKDYPSGRVDSDHPEPQFWNERNDYRPYLDQWQSRWQYADWLKKRR
ncbi:MAG: sulfatase-like hydrolase/transferase [Planctomycetota bacterium]